MKAYLIDGKKRQVKELEYDGTEGGLRKIIPYPSKFMDGHLVDDDMADGILHLKKELFDSDPQTIIDNDGAFGFICGECEQPHTIFGKGLWIGRKKVGDNEFEYAEPQWTVEQVRNWVKWPQIEIMKGDELQEIIGPLLEQMHEKIQEYVLKKYGKKTEDLSEPELQDAKSAVASMLATQAIASKTLH
jgi:hypothetical protein